MSSLKGGFGQLATIGEAFEVINANVPDLGSEKLRCSGSLGRVVHTPPTSEIDVPHFVKAAMDGFAVKAESTFGASLTSAVVLEVVESVMPGSIPETVLEPGDCVEIGTGAPMPDRADAVVMVENTEPAGESSVSIRKAVAPGENIIEVGSDVSAGAEILKVGTKIQPRHLGVMAACGIEWLSVVREPVVALFSTGPELVEAGGELAPGRIFDINHHTLKAALISDGCSVIELGIVPDDERSLDKAISESLERADLMVLSGGSSLGGGDLVDEAFKRAGELLLHGVAVKPGKPLVVGRADGPDLETGKSEPKLLIGLPGYPMSALSDYYIFVQPLIRRALGITNHPSFTHAPLRSKHASTVGRYEFLPVRLEDGEAVAISKGSSAISALAEADGFVEIAENTEVVEAGSVLRVTLF
jgi:molybdenum cofactor synthesis domain-containing protein